MAHGRSFFERLTGTVDVDDTEEEVEVREKQNIELEQADVESVSAHSEKRDLFEEESEEGQLTVDVFNTPDEIVIKAIVAGVRPDDLDIAITRDMVTIRGKRINSTEISTDDYFYRELYWGMFSRTILLPQEIEVDSAAANEKHGMLTIRLPKIDKEKQTKLKVKST